MKALIDQGSQSSFITEQAATGLGIKRKAVYAQISGIGNEDQRTSEWSVILNLEAHFENEFEMKVEALILRKITKNLTEKKIQMKERNHRNLVLADPNFNKTGSIDILLGGKEYSLMYCSRSNKRWFAHPKYKIGLDNARDSTRRHLGGGGELEEVDQSNALLVEEKECEEYYKRTVKRDTDGRFEVKIPFNSNTSLLGDSKQQAYARLLQLEKKFQSDRNLEKEYSKFMKEYEDLGHMKLNKTETINKPEYYLPHHAVIKEDSITTKCRAVLDASSKSSTGISLNDIMHSGPRLQQDLTNILINWRSYKIAYTADLEKMFRQIKIAEEDQVYQKTLWRQSVKEPIKEYQLLTVTYGTKAAPYFALRTIQELCNDEKLKYSLAAEIVKHNMYVDDVLAGSETLAEAHQAQTELTEMFKKGGFALRKWLSNSPDLMETIPEELKRKIELHGFADASTKGYEAVIYTRTLCPEVKTSLIVAKTKVAPVKGLTTLPRLELCVALLLSRLMKRTIQALNRSDVEIYAWSDSTITLAWIQGQPNRSKTFVANRVTEITGTIQPDRWFKVDTKETPADYLSRGIKAKELVRMDLWWNGPIWLKQTNIRFPLPERLDTDEEKKRIEIIANTTVKISDICERFSNLNRMQRVLSHCIIFADKCKKER
ncbi:uncharacterized protein [Diabrotica undecimpunctata]|uniref:uncharacterized protein n=1 Tax=Diabrotica undecimpunctata TaxID=50387 RepID=UPI003B6423AD